jgi:hypothetical protein
MVHNMLKIVRKSNEKTVLNYFNERPLPNSPWNF